MVGFNAPEIGGVPVGVLAPFYIYDPKLRDSTTTNSVGLDYS
jgi:hypothetical protein